MGLVDYIFTENIDTPIGMMVAGASSQGICLLEFINRRALPGEFRELKKLLNVEFIEAENPHIISIKNQLKNYFEGNLSEFTVPLHTPGTQFQQRVWDELLKIPYGETRSYKQQAIALGNPESVRAVANANGRNRVSIVIPCHRVIGDDGSLTGYGGGLERKRWLLEFEGRNVFNFL